MIERLTFYAKRNRPKTRTIKPFLLVCVYTSRWNSTIPLGGFLSYDDSNDVAARQQKTYVSGDNDRIRVPMREIVLEPSTDRNGEEVPNESVFVYDSSGPYTDLQYEADIRTGLPALRSEWITSRGDVESYEGRMVLPVDNGFVTEEKVEQRGEERYPGLKRQRCAPKKDTMSPNCITPAKVL